MLFKPSNILIDLLLKYGFTDLTERLYPEHYRRMQANGYDPFCIKRIFGYPPNGDYLMFHYTYIRLHHSGQFSHTEERKLLTADELKSLIVFYKLPVKAAKEWVEAYTNALELHKYYRNICQLPEVFNTPLDQRIKDTFDYVFIPGQSAVAEYAAVQALAR